MYISGKSSQETIFGHKLRISLTISLKHNIAVIMLF